jgi:hypothetical protein
LVLFSLLAANARASLVADSFVSGTGKYTTGNLNNQNPGAPGFTTGWTLGTGTTKFHVDPVADGLTASAVTYPSGGSVGLTGATADMNQTIGRGVSVPASTVYYMSGIYESGSVGGITPGAYAFMGWGNAVVPNASSSGSLMQGVYVGFTQSAATTSGGSLDDAASLVIRTRQNIGGTEENVDTTLVDGSVFPTAFNEYFVVTKLQLNTSGNNDTLTYWVNPTNITSETSMNNTALLFGSVTVDTAVSNASFSQLTFAESQFNAMFSFDEPRIATTLADLSAATPTPEPASLSLLAVSVFPMLLRRRPVRV